VQGYLSFRVRPMFLRMDLHRESGSDVEA
jgi:hypothetical protein